MKKNPIRSLIQIGKQFLSGCCIAIMLFTSRANATPINPNGLLLLKKDIVINGSVIDQSGGPIPGASVKIKGQTGGVVADANGKFR